MLAWWWRRSSRSLSSSPVFRDGGSRHRTRRIRTRRVRLARLGSQRRNQHVAFLVHMEVSIRLEFGQRPIARRIGGTAVHRSRVTGGHPPQLIEELADRLMLGRDLLQELADIRTPP